MRQLLFSGLISGLLVTGAWAAKQCTVAQINAPGVDAQGNCDMELAGVVNLKSCVSTRGKFRISAKGSVRNETNQTAKFTNSAQVLECFSDGGLFVWVAIGERIEKTLYKISKTGSAKLSVKGTVPLNN